jgi:hypothetical protein
LKYGVGGGGEWAFMSNDASFLSVIILMGIEWTLFKQFGFS